MRLCSFILFSIFLATTEQAIAVELGSQGNLLSVDVHGFVSQGFIATVNNNYLARDTKDGSFEFTEVGINFTKYLTDNLRLGVQLFSRELGDLGNYNIKADWYYLDYRFRDWLGFRVGRVKIPFGLYNDSSDMDAARMSVLLPQSIYPISSRDFLLAQTGGEIYGYLTLGKLGSLDYRAYVGAIFFDFPRTTLTTQYTSIDTPYVVGGRLLWETPVEGLRLGATVQALRIDASSVYNFPPPGGAASFKLPAVLWVTSVEYQKQKWLITAEYSRWLVDLTVSGPTPSKISTESERAYVMVGYQATSWLQPGVYYSILYNDVNQRHGRAAHQNDLTATFRFDINPFWLVKLESHYINGTAEVSPTFNGNTPQNALPENWAAFFVKTTAYF